MEDFKSSLKTTTIIDLDTDLMREQLEHADEMVRNAPTHYAGIALATPGTLVLAHNVPQAGLTYWSQM